MNEKPNLDVLRTQDNKSSMNEEFYFWLIKTKGYSPKLAYNNAHYLSKMLRLNGVNDSISNLDIDKILVYIRSSKYSKSHMGHLYTAFQYYLEFKGVKNEQGCLYNFKHLKPKPHRKAIRFLTLEQMRSMLDSTKDWKEAAIVMILVTTGARLSELCNTNIGDVDFTNHTILVQHGKWDKGRTVLTTEQCTRAIQEYLTHFNRSNAHPNEPLFLSIRGSRITPRTVEKIIKRLGQECNFTFTITPHCLRHSYSCYAIKETNIFDLAEQLGHSSISVTQMYLHLDNEAHREAYNRGVPRF